MDQREARQAGYDAGYDIAAYAEDLPEDKDAAIGACLECEDNARQMSPFEFLAHDINECGERAEGLWASYEAGVLAGVKAGLRAVQS